MKMNRSTLVALGAFVVLLAAALLTRESKVSVGVQKLSLPTIDPASVTALEISGSNKALLTLDSNGWQVADPAAPAKKFAADEGQVKNALTQLSELRAGDFVTENTAKHAELEVDETKGLKVKVSSAAPGPVLDLIIGKAAKTGGGAYVRLAASNAVFTANSAVGYALRKNVAAWRKKTLSIAALADVQKISMSPVTGDGFILERGEGDTWSLEGDVPAFFRFDAAAAARLAQTLTSLSAQDFSDADAEAFAAPHTLATLMMKDGKSMTIHFGATKRPDGNVLVRIDGDAQVYVISGYVFEQLATHRDQLRQTNLMAFDAAKVKRVTISTSGKKVIVVKDGAGWKMTEPKGNADFDPAQVAAVVTRWSSLRATRVAAMTSQAQAGLIKALPTLELTLEGGKTQRLIFGNEVTEGTMGKQVYAKGSADDLVYVVNAAEKSSFDAGPALFKAPPPMPAHSGMQGLDSLPPDIRAKIEAQLRQQQPH